MIPVTGFAWEERMAELEAAVVALRQELARSRATASWALAELERVRGEHSARLERVARETAGLA